MDPKQGIMALPESDQAPAPQLSLDESYDAVRQGLQNASPQASQMLDQAMQQFKPMLAQLDDKALDSVLQVVQYLKQNPDKYPELLAQLIAKGVLQPGVFPEQYDPEFLSTLMMVLTAEKKDRQQSPEQAPAQPEMAPPPGMARGGIADAARAVMRHGRSGDTMLAHINPQEAKMLEAHGGMGTINPTTGLHEYSFFDDIGRGLSDLGGSVSNALNDLGNSIKDFTKTPIGRIATTVALAYALGPAALGPAATFGLASAGATLIGGGDLKDALISGATAYFAAPGGVISNMVPVSNMALNAAITGGLVGTTSGLLQGKNLEDSVKAGLTQGAISGLSTGLSKGFTAQGAGPVKLETAPLPAASGVSDVSSQVTGTNVEGGASTGLQTSGMKVYPDVKALQVDTDQNLVKPGEVVNVGGQHYQFAPSEAQPKYFEPVDVGARGPSVGAGVGPDVQGAIKAANTPAYATNFPVKPEYKFTDLEGAKANIIGAPKPIVAVNNFGQGAANVGSTPPPVEVTGPPTYGEAAGNIFGGLKKMLPGTQGSFSSGYEDLSKGIGQLYSPSLSNAELKNTAEYQSAIDSGKTIGASLKEAAEVHNPGIFRSYAPGVATALGATYALGGFDPKERPKSEQELAMEDRWKTQKASVAASPGSYTPQGLGKYGIVYNDKGEIVGGNAWTPTNLNPTEVTPSYIPYTPRRYAAAGGIASLATGGYPRRTGQIAGPGTATSDSIPAMLSDGEFVMTAKAVRGAGKGSRLAGAKKMYSLMHQLERNASRK